eukprot:3346610-Prymnesium_polylepis.1
MRKPRRRHESSDAAAKALASEARLYAARPARRHESTRAGCTTRRVIEKGTLRAVWCTGHRTLQSRVGPEAGHRRSQRTTVLLLALWTALLLHMRVALCVLC